MTLAEKKVIAHLIDHTFNSEVVPSLNCFLDEFRKTIAFKIQYKIITGFDIELEKPLQFDLSAPMQKLLNNIILVVENSKKNESK
jgi:hypothetical protein